MSERTEQSEITRREALTTLARYGALAGIAVSLTVLATRAGACPTESPCARCGRFESCDLEKAQQARKERT